MPKNRCWKKSCDCNGFLMLDCWLECSASKTAVSSPITPSRRSEWSISCVVQAPIGPKNQHLHAPPFTCERGKRKGGGGVVETRFKHTPLHSSPLLLSCFLACSRSSNYVPAHPRQSHAMQKYRWGTAVLDIDMHIILIFRTFELEGTLDLIGGLME
jgi:hypothetical protein